MQTGRFARALEDEIAALRVDRWLLALVVWLPPLLSLFLLLVFSAGKPLNLPIGVVDLDHSSLSRKIAHYFEASPALKITRHYASIAEGKADISDAHIYALVVIPAKLSRDAMRGEAPAISVFFNAQYLLVAKAIRAAVIEIETTLAVELDVGKTLVTLPVINAALAISLPVRSQMTALYNLNMNYATFLVPALLVAMFQLLIICATILSLGKRDKEEGATVDPANGVAQLAARLAGRSTLYTCLFSIHILASLAFLYGALDWPHQASLAELLPLLILFVLACQLLGAFFYVLTFNQVKSLSLAGAFSAPAFAFLGVTFPASEMSVFAQFWRDLMPAAHYMNGFLNQVAYAAGPAHLIEGLAGVVMTTGATERVRELMLQGMPLGYAVRDWSPIHLNERPLFNLGMGYLDYVIPAIFILILQQTLLLACGLLGAESKKKAGFSIAQAAAVFGARFAVMFLVYFLLTQFYMGACFDYYGISRNAGILDLWMMMAAFLSAVVALGILLGLVLPRRELAAPMVMISSLPMVFTAGFVWPRELLPEPVLWISQWFPSTSAIQGFLKLNQMGAEFSLVLVHWWSLWALAGFFTVLSLILLTRPARRLGVVTSSIATAINR